MIAPLEFGEDGAVEAGAGALRLLGIFRGALWADIEEQDVHESQDPLSNFIDWLDEPDKALESGGQTVYYWSPVRIASVRTVFEVAVIDMGSSRGVYIGTQPSERTVGPSPIAVNSVFV
jgi:hypothetical protein